MENHNWETIKWAATIVFAILSFIDRFVQWNNKKVEIQKEDPKVTILSYTFAEPFTYSLILFTALTLSQIKYVNLSEILDGRTEINSLSRNLNNTYDAIGNNKILKSIVDDKIEALNNFTSYATSNEKNIRITNKSDFITTAGKIFEMADDNSTILATSYVNKDNWWYGIEGEEYMKKNYNFVKNKKGTIKRIHIFANQDEFRFYKKLLAKERENGIDVKYVYVEDIPKELDYDLKQDIIVLGGEFAGRLELNDGRTPKLINYYASETKVSELNKVFSNLQKYSTEFIP